MMTDQLKLFDDPPPAKLGGSLLGESEITLMCGDCLERMGEIAPGSIDMVMADPPYGTTACKWDSIIPLDAMWAHLKRVTKPNAAIVMTASQPFTTTLISSNMAMFKYCWVWVKNTVTGFPNANIQPLRNNEDIAVFYQHQTTFHPQGIKHIKHIKHRRPRESIFSGENDGSLCGEYVQTYTNYPKAVLKTDSQIDTVHPTQKPVALMAYMIRTYTNAGDTVLDFCMGSGTTGVAAKQLGRHFIGIEKEREYFDIAKQRIDSA
jgi:site-specific DNA-methyltransferase (adenine-specific)